MQRQDTADKKETLQQRKTMFAASSKSVAFLCLCLGLLSGGQTHRHANKTVEATAEACKYRSEIHCFDWMHRCSDIPYMGVPS